MADANQICDRCRKEPPVPLKGATLCYDCLEQRLQERLDGKPDMPKDVFHLGNDFSKCPGGRFKSDGSKSGEDLREHLVKALENSDCLEVCLDGMMGLPASFTEEAFGGLVRQLGPSVIPRLKLTGWAGHVDMVSSFMDDAAAPELGFNVCGRNTGSGRCRLRGDHGEECMSYAQLNRKLDEAGDGSARSTRPMTDDD